MAYGNNLFQPYMQQQYVPNYYQQQQNFQPVQQNMQQVLHGKIVDNEDVVRIQEIPLGGYGIYPKADMSCIFIKVWNNDGTTRVLKYSPIVDCIEDSTQDKTTSVDEILERISILDKKIDDVLSQGGIL